MSLLPRGDFRERGREIPDPIAHSYEDGCLLTVLGAWLRKRSNMSHSQCYGAEASASQIGSRVVSGVDLYSIVKELVGTAGRNTPRAGPQNEFRVVPEHDQGVARGPGGPPYYGTVFSGGGADGFVCSALLSYAAAGIWRPDFGFTRVFA